MVIIRKLYPNVIKTCRPLILEDLVLKALVNKFSESISKSLSAEHVSSSPVKCNLTYISDFPDGKETGGYIGLDFSGKTFRLVYVGLKGDRSYVTLSRLYEFPEQKLSESATKVVEYVARCVNNFIDEYGINETKTILGVATSFSMEQECLQEGVLVQWGQDFKSCDLQGRDFFLHLKIALKKYKFTKSIYLVSLVSSATACLLAGLYKDPGMRIGLYLGDETNVTYVEKFANMTTHTGDGLRTRTALNVEMKNFGDDGSLNFIRTNFDFQIDAASSDPGTKVLEKLVSAAYLGEIARLHLYKLASDGVILKGYVSPALSMKNSFKTSDMAIMEMDDENEFIRCKAVMWNLGYKTVSNEDCIQIRFVCRSVAKRSCNLVAACLTAMIHRMDTKYVHIMADGFLLKDFPNYEKYLIKKINQLKKPEYKFMILKGDKDEVAVGAGLVAHIYKDGVVKLEDKHRSLPPFNINKYNLNNIPASLIDCECDSEETKLQSVTTMLTRLSCDSKKDSIVFEAPDPVYSAPLG